VADASVQWSDVVALRNLASPSFRSVYLVTNSEHVDGWISGSNSLWLAAAQWANAHGRAFWFHEPDAICLRAGWLDALELGWVMAGSPKYFGAVVRHQVHGLPNPYLEGCSIYHADAVHEMMPPFDVSKSWTLACAPVTMPAAVNTPLIQHFWGEKDLAPTFAEVKAPDSPVNTFTADTLSAGAVVFHRNKDGTLVQLLRRKLHLPAKFTAPRELVLVFPYSVKDQMLAEKNMAWIAEMAGPTKLDRTCVIHFDGAVDSYYTGSIIRNATQAFTNVIQSRYPTPRAPYMGWPGACNWAFQHAVRFMEAQGRNSWLWLEPDAIPTRSDWLTALESEYARGGRPFMGTIIGGMGHMNGVAIYPWNTADYVPSAMAAVSQPWDTAMMAEVIPHTHRGNDYIFHCRAVRNGRCVDEHGAAPAFTSVRDLSMVEPNVRVFHPCKDGELIKYLRIFKR